MFSKLATYAARGKLATSYGSMTNMAKASFRSSQALNKKLSIGEAAVVLESKIAGISQVVSISLAHLFRTTLLNSEMSSLLAMVSQESLDLMKCRLERWLSSPLE